jgi:hypothetical protein
MDGKIYHEAGFDALATGAVWFKIMTYLGRERKFPGVDKILENNLHRTLDKNKIPMSSIRTSMNLDQDHSGLATDAKSFVFVLQNVPLHLTNEEIQGILSKKFTTDCKVYRAYNKNHVFFTVFGKNNEEQIHEMLK